jgi:hypothetical protein
MDALLKFERAQVRLLEQFDQAAAEDLRQQFARIHAQESLKACIPPRKA